VAPSEGLTMSSPETVDVPVLIVGARPAGLALSVTLSRYGVGHLVVERHEGTAHTRRAHIINQWTVEIFRHLGIGERLPRDRHAVALHGQQPVGDNPRRPRSRAIGDVGDRRPASRRAASWCVRIGMWRGDRAVTRQAVPQELAAAVDQALGLATAKARVTDGRCWGGRRRTSPC